MNDKQQEFEFFCKRLKELGFEYRGIFILWQIKNQLRDPKHLKKLRAINDNNINNAIWHEHDVTDERVGNLAETEHCICIAEDLYDILLCDYG